MLHRGVGEGGGHPREQEDLDDSNEPPDEGVVTGIFKNEVEIINIVAVKVAKIKVVCCLKLRVCQLLIKY